MPFSGVVKRNGTLVGVGYAFELLEMVRSKVPFDYTIVLPEEDGLGNEKNGITSLVERKEVDMVVAFVPVIPEYWRYFKYGTTLDEVEWTVLMGRPSESASGSGLLAPFDTVVWSLVLVSVLVVGPVVYLLVSLRAKLAKAEKPERYSLATCMWFVYGALLKQGSTVSPVSDSARLLFAAWWIFVTILTSFYTANLTAFLTLSEFKLPIDSLGDLVNKNLQWSMPKGRSIDVVLQEKLPDKELEVLGRSKFPWRSGLIDLSAESTEDILKRIDKRLQAQDEERPGGGEALQLRHHAQEHPRREARLRFPVGLRHRRAHQRADGEDRPGGYTEAPGDPREPVRRDLPVEPRLEGEATSQLGSLHDLQGRRRRVRGGDAALRGRTTRPSVHPPGFRPRVSAAAAPWPPLSGDSRAALRQDASGQRPGVLRGRGEGRVHAPRPSADAVGRPLPLRRLIALDLVCPVALTRPSSLHRDAREYILAIDPTRLHS
ncbi:glutamate receptor ionotropic, delta-2 isoform X3 [Orussus abietinus]|uniref:glutamate receptor ionotropic, delta-2 isoform X3 n=1 Tax=Orussus abietinus TaxID=222816 RepID=UPI000C7162BE|nr:glutamate receptor ionotropic, delta-2 isoform X3 [Orussus abietinus]